MWGVDSLGPMLQGLGPIPPPGFYDYRALLQDSIRLMIEILHYLKDPKLREFMV